MKIAVFIKQVPLVSDGEMDPETGFLIRSDQTVTNPDDLAALEMALRFKDKSGAEISVFTMGPESGTEVIIDAYGRGADKGYLITGKEFAGSDVLATSNTLAQAAQSQGSFDMYFFGDKTTDGDTGQVSGEFAERLGLDHYNYVEEINDFTEDEMVLTQHTSEGHRTVSARNRAVLTFSSSDIVCRLPNISNKLKSKKKEIFRLNLEDFQDKNPGNYGFRGSATRVIEIFVPQRKKIDEVIVMTGREAAEHIDEIIKNL